MDHENCKCRKKLVEKLIDECTKTIEDVKLAKINFTENESENKYSSCTVYIVLMIVVFTIFTGITTFLLITIGLWLKIMFLALNLVLTKKQKFGECNSIEWTYKWEKSDKLVLKIELIIFTTIKSI